MIFEKQEQYYERTISYLSQKVSNLEIKSRRLEERVQSLEIVLIFVFILSSFGMLLIIERMLNPWLRTL